ncbi:hypothetical protein ACFL35_20750 [Candidatus Riflebacteria bacterium]
MSWLSDFLPPEYFFSRHPDFKRLVYLPLRDTRAFIENELMQSFSILEQGLKDLSPGTSHLLGRSLLLGESIPGRGEIFEYCKDEFGALRSFFQLNFCREEEVEAFGFHPLRLDILEIYSHLKWIWLKEVFLKPLVLEIYHILENLEELQESDRAEDLKYLYDYIFSISDYSFEDVQIPLIPVDEQEEEEFFEISPQPGAQISYRIQDFKVSLNMATLQRLPLLGILGLNPVFFLRFLYQLNLVLAELGWLSLLQGVKNYFIHGAELPEKLGIMQEFAPGISQFEFVFYSKRYKTLENIAFIFIKKANRVLRGIAFFAALDSQKDSFSPHISIEDEKEWQEDEGEIDCVPEENSKISAYLVVARLSAAIPERYVAAKEVVEKVCFSYTSSDLPLYWYEPWKRLLFSYIFYWFKYFFLLKSWLLKKPTSLLKWGAYNSIVVVLFFILGIKMTPWVFFGPLPSGPADYYSHITAPIPPAINCLFVPAVNILKGKKDSPDIELGLKDALQTHIPFSGMYNNLTAFYRQQRHRYTIFTGILHILGFRLREYGDGEFFSSPFFLTATLSEYEKRKKELQKQIRQARIDRGQPAREKLREKMEFLQVCIKQAKKRIEMERLRVEIASHSIVPFEPQRSSIK